MRVTIITLGSRGDVYPFVLLARALGEAGYDVKVGGPPNFAEYARSFAVDYRSVGYDTEALHRDAEAARIIGSGRTGAAFFGGTLRRLQERQARITHDAWEVAQGAQFLLYKGGFSAGPTIAEALGIPQLQIALQPMRPTREFPPPLAGAIRDYGGMSNRLLGHLVNVGIDAIGRPGVDTLRKFLGLRRQSQVSLGARKSPPTLGAYSPRVVPKPADWPDADEVTGFLFGPPRPYDPPPELVSFLDRGPKPICIGFGSMTHVDPVQLSSTIAGAVRGAGVRAILLQGWGNVQFPEDMSDDVYVLPGVPHEWLYPRVASVIHHGGAGTTAAALRAGVPSMAVPHNFDQPFWGRRIHAMGVAPPPLPLRDVDGPVLRDRICALVSDDVMRGRAEALGRKIREEDGVGAVIRAVERLSGRSPESRHHVLRTARTI